MGDFETGKAVTAAQFSAASGGDVSNNVAIDFGTAGEDAGTVTHWSLYKGSSPVAYGTLPSTTINNGDTFQITSGSLQPKRLYFLVANKSYLTF